MKLEQLLSYEDYKKGLKAIYEEFNLDPSRESVEDLLVDENNKYLMDNYKWDLSQLWDLDRSIFVFLLPRLYVFYKTDFTGEQEYEDGAFKEILESILDALLNLLYSKEGFKDSEHDEVKINKGMLLFGKYIRRLWN